MTTLWKETLQPLSCSARNCAILPTAPCLQLTQALISGHLSIHSDAYQISLSLHCSHPQRSGMSTTEEINFEQNPVTETLHEGTNEAAGDNSINAPSGNTKYGVPSNRPPAVSSFLQKRLQKGQKFFDSGDYNMAKSMKSSKPHITAGAPNPSATVKRNLPLLLPPGQEENPLPVLTPEDLPHHSHPAHEPSKLVTDQIQAPTSSA